MTQEFKKTVSEGPQTAWYTLYREVNGQRVDTGQQYAEVCFVPNWKAAKKDGPTYRFLAVRDPLDQLALPGMEG